MKRPILWALGFLIGGVLIRTMEGFPLLPVFGFGLCLILCAFLYRVYKYKPVFIFALFFVLGIWRVGHSLHSHTTEPFEAEFSGVVLDISVTQGGNQRVVIRGAHPETDGRVRFMAYIRPHLPWVRIGQQAAFTGEALPLARAANPGGYDQFRHMRTQKIDAVIWPESVMPGEMRNTPMSLLRRARDRLAAVYDELLPVREAGVMKSMVLGERADMSQELAEMYRAMGIFHILSISGLHVTVLMMAVNKLLGLVMNERRAGVPVIVIMVLYCLFTGAAAATVRAVTMGGTLILAKILYRDTDMNASISVACAALLIFEPLYLFNVGFQLSFGAVYGMGILTSPLERAMLKLKLPLLRRHSMRRFREVLAAGIAAVVSTYIIFAFHFYEIPLYSVLGNLVIMPTTTLILVLGLAVGLAGLVFMPLAHLLSGAVFYILRFYELAAVFFSSLPFAMLRTGGGSVIVAALGVLVLGLFAYMFYGYEKDFHRRGLVLAASVIVLAAAIFIRANPPGLQMTALYTPGNYTVLRHRADTLIIGNPLGGEDALLHYLDRFAVSRASLLLPEPPRPQDITRLARLTERINTLYLPGDVTEITASITEEALAELKELSGHVPDIVFLEHGDMRVSNRLSVLVYEEPRGRTGIRIMFRGRDVKVISSA